MKWVFAGFALALSLLSVVAWRLTPSTVQPGKRMLTWVSDDNPLRQGQMALFNRLYPPNEAVLDPNNGDLEKIIVQSIAGVGPDVFDSGDGFQLAAYVKSGVAMDLTDILKQHGIDIPAEAFPGTSAVSTYDGRIYGVPTNLAVDAVWFHRDLFDKAHVPYPKGPITWDQIIPIAQRLTQRDSTGRITRFGLMIAWWNWKHILYGFGANVFNADGTRCTLDSPQAIQAVQLMHDLVYKYHVSPSPVDSASMAAQGGWGSGDINLFSAQQVAMAMGGRWWLAQLRKDKDLNLGVCESPYGTVRQFRAYGRATLVNKNSKNLQGAIDFMVYAAGPQYNQLINDQADGTSAFPKYDQGERFLHNPEYPKETYNDVWWQSANHAIADRVSLFVDANEAGRLIQKQFDLVQADLKTPAQAMKDATRDVNEEIQKTLQLDPQLAERYRRLTQGRHP